MTEMIVKARTVEAMIRLAILFKQALDECLAVGAGARDCESILVDGGRQSCGERVCHEDREGWWDGGRERARAKARG